MTKNEYIEVLAKKQSDGWQPCPLCGGKGGIVRFAGGGGTVAVRHACDYCNGSGHVRSNLPTTDTLDIQSCKT